MRQQPRPARVDHWIVSHFHRFRLSDGGAGLKRWLTTLLILLLALPLLPAGVAKAADLALCGTTATDVTWGADSSVQLLQVDNDGITKNALDLSTGERTFTYSSNNKDLWFEGATGNFWVAHNGWGMVDLGKVDYAGLKQVPANGYLAKLRVVQGHVYALRRDASTQVYKLFVSTYNGGMYPNVTLKYASGTAQCKPSSEVAAADPWGAPQDAMLEQADNLDAISRDGFVLATGERRPWGNQGGDFGLVAGPYLQTFTGGFIDLGPVAWNSIKSRPAKGWQEKAPLVPGHVLLFQGASIAKIQVLNVDVSQGNAVALRYSVATGDVPVVGTDDGTQSGGGGPGLPPGGSGGLPGGGGGLPGGDVGLPGGGGGLPGGGGGLPGGGGAGQNVGITGLTYSVTGGKVTLIWDVPNPAPTGGYYVYRDTTSGFTPGTPLSDFPVLDNSFTDDKATAGGTYYYVVQAVGGGWSGELKVVVADTAPSPNPQPPGGGVSHVVRFTLDSQQVEVDGQGKTIDVAPTLIGGRAMVPLRFLAESLGAQINFDPTDRKITYQLGSVQLTLWVDRTDAIVNGQSKTLDVPPTIVGGRALVPLRFVSENLGAQVQFDAATRTATVNYSGGSQQVKDATYYRKLGDAALDHGDYDAAIAAYVEALNLKPDFVHGYNGLGMAYQRKGDYDRALRNYTRALALRQDAVIYTNRAGAYYDEGDYDNAIADATQAIALKADYAAAYAMRGDAYYAQHDWATAVSDYTHAITLKPGNAVYLTDRGSAYYHQDQAALALTDLKAALQLSPRYARAWNMAGLVVSNQKLWDDAIRFFTEAINIQPAAAYFYNRGDAYKGKGDSAAAIADYQQVINLGTSIDLTARAKQRLQELGAQPQPQPQPTGGGAPSAAYAVRGNQRLVKLDFAAGKIGPVFDAANGIYEFRLNPAKDAIAYSDASGRLIVRSLKDGTETVLFTPAKGQYDPSVVLNGGMRYNAAMPMSWLGDKLVIFMLYGDNDKKPQLLVIAADGSSQGRAKVLGSGYDIVATKDLIVTGDGTALSLFTSVPLTNGKKLQLDGMDVITWYTQEISFHASVSDNSKYLTYVGRGALKVYSYNLGTGAGGLVYDAGTVLGAVLSPRISNDGSSILFTQSIAVGAATGKLMLWQNGKVRTLTADSDYSNPDW